MIKLNEHFQSLVITTILICLSGCSSEVHVLTIGDIGYSKEDLLGLSSDRRSKLAEITAFGMAVSKEDVDRILKPAVDRAQDRALLEQLAAERFIEALSISENELRTHYATNPSFELVVRHILFFSERWRSIAHRDNARSKAEMALFRLNSGDNFPKIAAELSEEPGAEGRQGLLEPGRKGSWVSEFWDAAIVLEIDGISPVTETQYGFHILRLEGKTEIAFQQVRPSVVLQVANLMGFRKDIPTELGLDDAIAAEITIPEEVSNKLLRDWQEKNLRWATFLRFETGLSNEEVKRLSQAALGSTGQNATIARNELDEVGHLLLAAYPMTDQLTP